MHITSAQQTNHVHKNFDADHKILLIFNVNVFNSEEVIISDAHMFFSLVLTRASGDLVWCSQCTVWPIEYNYKNDILAYNYNIFIIVAINSIIELFWIK